MDKKFIDIAVLNKLFDKNINLTKFLHKKYNNMSEEQIIETIYDVQTGSYIEWAMKNPQIQRNYCKEIVEIIDSMKEKSFANYLDAGVGELTTLCDITSKIKKKVSSIYVCDLSWSRLFAGLKFSKKYKNIKHKIKPFCSDMKCLPLPDSSIDLVTTHHSIEPNFMNVDLVVKELFRVAKKKILFFEPCYQFNSVAGKKRMNTHRFVKDLEPYIKKNGGSLIKKIKIENPFNPLNATACYVIELKKKRRNRNITFTFPGENFSLIKKNNFYLSNHFGVSFPILKDIPILRKENAILSSIIC